VSYDQRYLFDAIVLSLRKKPFGMLNNLSRELGVSRGTIGRTVVAVTGKNFRCLKEAILFEQVQTLFMSRPGCTLKEVSFQLGCGSPSSFSRTIKRACGHSPEELRSQVLACQLFIRAELPVSPERFGGKRLNDTGDAPLNLFTS
jgi:AraC-like DNA-binding protein